MCQEEINNLKNNHLCKHRLVIVLRFHTECKFSLACIFLFSLPLFSPYIINHLQKVNCCNVLFVFTFVGDFGENCFLSV